MSEEMPHIDPQHRDPNDWWFAYECSGPCTAVGSGAVLDLRVTDPTGRREPPRVICPLCETPMDFRGKWNACKNGYGSRASPCGGKADAP